ncbi:hypothetical protein F4813DRAFT_396903 [Daldinia decipiens]|uniref:uncharacterized protein n=1 Tax=Daldinia decipiens TaxID=326647 RepID=UPI0020C1DCA6|nr:uncharacterized protein F4813DRAFT_396903 [Daldinia decipiens]KAI1662206.1 hypothetical protein F4813DRAFT_396903 [Daldinia decipiens]
MEADDRGPGLRSFVIVMLILTVVAITLRFWSRSLSTSHKLRFWWDDWIALTAVPFVVVEFGLIFYMLSLGLGRHMNTLPTENVAKSLLSLHSCYLAAFSPEKCTELGSIIAFGLLMRSIFSWLLGIIFGTVFMCDPVAKNYIPDMDGRCVDTGALWIGSAVPSVLIDLFILVLPLPKIWGLQMSLAKRSGITLVFMLGYCVIIVSLGRLITVIKSADSLATDLTCELAHYTDNGIHPPLASINTFLICSGSSLIL